MPSESEDTTAQQGLIEVEQKYHVDDPIVLRERLAQLGAIEQPQQQHSDTYYNHPCRDFAETHEALRLRRCDGVPMVTYKGTKLPGAVKARRELEWRLDPGDDDGTKMESLLVLLGFRAVATVKKTRCSFLISHDKTEFTATIDQVDSLACFAEIERVVSDGEIEVARQQIVDLAPKLGLHQAESRSYLRMLLEVVEKQA